MKRQLLGRLQGKSIFFAKFVLINFLFIGFILPSLAQTETAMLRVGHFVFDELPVNLYIDGTAVMDADATPFAIDPMTLPYEYLELSADSHSFVFTLDAQPLADSLTEAEFTLEAEHHYLLAFLGNVAADDLHFSLIDETAGLEAFDLSISAVTIQINNVYGPVALDATLGGEAAYTNLPYGDYVFAQDPVGVQGSKIFVSGEPDSVVFEFSGAVASPPDTLAVFVFSGTFPGTHWEDYGELYSVQYFGELDIVDAGVIAVGDSLTVSFDGVGQRIHYTLSLAETTTLDILLASTDLAMGADAMLRIYNEAGDLILENDELTMDDNEAGNYDAGALGLELEAGTYVIEAATFVDSGIGEFNLSVSAAE